MSKPNSEAVAAKAIETALEGHTYAEMDCQAFIEYCVNQCGGNMTYLGSNDMYRNSMTYLATIDNAMAEGKLVPGAGLLIVEEVSDTTPAKYRGDGLGDATHIGFYVGENALTDTDKNGISRACNTVHSSESRERVVGGTTNGGWTHVMLFKEIEYGVDVVPGVTLGATVDESVQPAYDEDGNETENAPEEGTYDVIPATVYADNGKSVKIRAKPSTTCDVYWTRDVGTELEVLEKGETWCKVRSRSRVGYMMTKFLQF